MIIMIIFSRFTVFCSEYTETATRGVLWKKVFLEILQNSKKNTCADFFFDKVAGVRITKNLELSIKM